MTRFRFLIDILGLPEVLAAQGGALRRLRAKLSLEPSIAGSEGRASH